MMGTMSPEPQPAGTDASDPAAVLEWGGEPDDDTGPAPRRRAPARLAREFLDDRRLVPLTALLGGVALFASLFSEWQITEVDSTIFGGSTNGNQPVPSGIGELGGWAGGYLAGVFLLVTATVLLLFGPSGGRRYARLAALSTGGVLLALLAALASDLDENSRAVERLVLIQLQADQFEVAYGRGIWCALFGAAATTLAAYLAGRHLAPEPVRRAIAVTADESPAGDEIADRTIDGPAGDWLWRRPAAGRDDEVPGAPLELTVSPATPFTPQSDDRDKLR
jgi:hypothetical protein